MPDSAMVNPEEHLGPPQVLLVEDDESIQQFVAAVLEEADVELVTCPNLETARQALENSANGAALVLLDMMLPDGSGLELLRDPLRQSHGARAHWVVFSAGMPLPVREALKGLNVKQILEKPVSVTLLLDSVETACLHWLDRSKAGLSSQTDPVLQRDADAAPSDTSTHRPSDGSAVAKAHAIESFFFGQANLFLTMEDSVRQRIPGDIEQADAALAQSNIRQLQRSAHNLKSVLRMMGRPHAGDMAQALEIAAASSAGGSTKDSGSGLSVASCNATELARLQSLWNALKTELIRWLDS